MALLDARGERTIIVQGERLVPKGEDNLPWECLAEMDGIYFTGGDADALRAARAARTLVATPRAHDAFTGSDVTLDALVRSAGGRGGAGRLVGRPDSVDARAGWRDLHHRRWSYRLVRGSATPGPVVDAYGAGDSFAAGLTFALGSGMDIDAALALAARCGAANITGAGPYAGQLTAAAWQQ